MHTMQLETLACMCCIHALHRPARKLQQLLTFMHGWNDQKIPIAYQINAQSALYIVGSGWQTIVEIRARMVQSNAILRTRKRRT
mmetsp:Transcript_10958/g.67776  ORF Transcript_10958/g.67776 Transcript_10958/m.67776 type:complete len:84 (+) Transcript_10958:609-860(+)